MHEGSNARVGVRSQRMRATIGLLGALALTTTALAGCRPGPGTTTTTRATTKPTSGPTSTRATTRTTTGPTVTSPPSSGSSAADGWAGTNGGTRGGTGGPTVTVTSGAALTEALKKAGPQVIKVQGIISPDGMQRVPSNTTIIGVGANSGISKGGLNVHEAHNVIIRNLVFRDADDDSINVEKSTNVWIDHNDLSNGYDGLVDIKHGSDFVTVSWNHVHDHHKTMLLGHSDNNGSEDTGHLRVTYHHNFFDGTQTRHPRVRFGNPVHVYNNYYRGNDYGVASTEGAGVLVEGNYFENVKSPTLVGYESSGPGALVQRNNEFVGSGTPQASGSVAAIPYSYNAESPASVKSRVPAGAGTGKVSG